MKCVKYTPNRESSQLQLLQGLLIVFTQLNDEITSSLNIVEQYCLVRLNVCSFVVTVCLVMNPSLLMPTMFFSVLILYFMFDQGRGGRGCLMPRNSPTTRNRAD